MALTIASCTSEPKVTKISHSSSPLRPLSLLGEQRFPFLSTNEDKFIYISWNRPGILQSQVFEYDRIFKTERRVTFLNGRSDFPVYDPQNKIYYISDTDFLKEAPFLTTTLPLGGEVYSTDLAKAQIDRITEDLSPKSHLVPVAGGLVWIRWSPSPTLIFWNQHRQIEFRQNTLISDIFPHQNKQSILLHEKGVDSDSWKVLNVQTQKLSLFPVPALNISAIGPTHWPNVYVIFEEEKNENILTKMSFWNAEEQISCPWVTVPGTVGSLNPSQKQGGSWLVSWKQKASDKTTELLYELDLPAKPPTCLSPPTTATL